MAPLRIQGGTLEQLRRYAEAHPISYGEALNIAARLAPEVHDREDYTRVVPPGFRVACSLEQRLVGRGPAWFRRVHVSVDTPGQFPTLLDLAAAARELGLPDLEHCRLAVDRQPEAFVAEAADHHYTPPEPAP